MFIKPDELKMITPLELHQLMQKKDIFLVDVHIPEQPHIKGTDLFVPFHKIEENFDKFPKDKRTPIYVYCLSAPMANAAARALLELGFTEIYNLKGGTKAWLDAGYVLE
ncbi:MAG: rhodanese-like domain-containing protein [Candidatus Scalindua sp.]